MPRSHYEVLEVARGASTAEIHRAYRRLARRYHPDVNPSSGARTRFDELSRAYEVLHDPKRRAAYDRATTLDRASPIRTGSRVDSRRVPAFVPRPRPDAPRFIDDLPGRAFRVRGVVIHLSFSFRWRP
jgi:curved DNA-binding protein